MITSITQMASILLVEDNVDDSVLTQIAFSQGDLANPVVTAHTGHEALDYLFDTRMPLPVVVLLDLNLPDMAGVDVIRAIKQHDRTWSVPVIVLTGDSDAEVMSSLAGATGYLVKPLNLENFLNASRKAGLRWMIMAGENDV